MKKEQENIRLQKEIDELKQQLEETTDMLNTIRSGQIDALVIENGEGHQLYTLKTADLAYRVFIETMKEGALTLNTSNDIVYSNGQFADLMHVPLSKIIGQSLERFVHTTDKIKYEMLLDEGWTSDSRGEILLEDANGRIIPCLLSLIFMDLQDGRELSIVVTDLSNLKDTEKELQSKNDELEFARSKVSKMNEDLEILVKDRTSDLSQSREHFKFLADNVPVIVWTVGADGVIDYLNKRWYDYTGMRTVYSNEDIFQLIHPDDRERFEQLWQQALDTNIDFHVDYRLRSLKDDKYRWQSLYMQQLRDEEENHSTWFGTSTDIEHQKKEMAKKDEFIGIASHELKTPLASLKGYLQLIGRHPDLPVPTDQYVRRANEAINKLHHLVNDLLDVSKIHAGKLQFTKEKVDMCALVEACVQNSEHIYPGIQIRSKLIPNCFVFGNEERLEQVIMNLINNAVKYSREEKKIEVAVKTNSNNVVVTIKDFGIGLSEADQDKIFERFYQVRDKSFLASGLGMGLYISSEIIKGHGGSMQVESALSEGSTFSFSLPLMVKEKVTA